MALDWADYQPPAPRQLGVFPVAAGIETLRHYIDWTPFFMTGRWRANTRASRKTRWWGRERLFHDANQMLDRLAAERSPQPARRLRPVRPTASATTWKYTATNGVTRCWR